MTMKIGDIKPRWLRRVALVASGPVLVLALVAIAALGVGSAIIEGAKAAVDELREIVRGTAKVCGAYARTWRI